MPASGGSSELYSRKTGFIYVFNLIVGTGALALPAAFAKTGWFLGTGIILVLALISFMTATFVIEAMSIANSVLLKNKRAKSRLDGSLVDDDEEPSSRYLNSRARDRERDPLIPPEFGDQNEDIRRQTSTASTFEIIQRVEMGRMAAMFLPKYGLYLFYLCLCIYLYGDLAIYITAVATSLRDITCTYNANLSTSSLELEWFDPESNNGNGSSSNSTDILPDGPCWSETIQVTRYDAYRLYTILFIVILGPFTFFNVQKTKYLQMFTTTMRWAAFIIMMVLASIKLAKGGDGLGHPPAANVLALPNFFGVCVYSFMCHHSLPSLVSPIANKRGIFRLFFLDYGIITIFYLLLALTGIFAFDDIKALYTLNFEPDHDAKEHIAFVHLFIQYFLSLFPVFTLSTNFPIIAITLRNNLKTLFNLREDEDEDDDYYIDDSETTTTTSSGPSEGLSNQDSASNTVNGFIATTSSGRDRRLSRPRNTSWCLKMCTYLGFPLLAIAPPFTVALFVENVQLLVSVTGSYAGTGIQYIVPMALVYQARKQLNQSTIHLNPYSSPFRHSIWIWFVIAWSAICIIFVTVNYIMHPDAATGGGPTSSFASTNAHLVLPVYTL